MVPQSRGTRKFTASEENWGGKTEPAEDRAGFKTRVFSSHPLLAQAQGSCPSFGCQDIVLHPSPPSYHHSTKVLLGNFRVGVGRACVPVAFAHPGVPGARPSASCASWGGAVLVRTRFCTGAPQFITAELAMMFTPQAPEPRCK